MRNFFSFFALYLTLLFGVANTVLAQETKTVAAGSSTNNYIPLYGAYVDEYIHTQIIYPADSVSAMSGNSITGITFYLSSPAAASWGAARFEIGLAEVSQNGFGTSSFVSSFHSASLTTVYSGALDGTQTTMTITFDSPYTYNGGNLLFDLKSTAKGTWKSATFSGDFDIDRQYVSITGSNGTSVASVTPNSSRNSKFLPKTTFTYESTTPVTCPKPGSLTAVSTSSTTATITWKRKGSETAWDLQYSDDNFATNTELNLTTTEVTIVGDNCSYTLTGLSASTSYKVQVQANCGGGDESGYTSIASFTTPCGEITSLPWSEDFTGMTNDIVPPCWDKSASTSTTDQYAAESDVVWTVHNGLLWMKNFHANTGDAVINTPIIVLPNKKCELVFDYNHRADCGHLIVKVSDDGGSTFTQVWESGNGSGYGYANPSNWDFSTISLTEQSVSLEAYKGKTIIIQFYTRANYGQGAILVDNVLVHRVTTCFTPSTPTVSHILNTTARLTWTAGGTESTWNVLYKKSADSEWTTISNVTANPYTLTGLDYATSYDVKIQAVCGEDDESDYSGITTFTTPCTAINVPWTENFESTPLQALATCWDNSASTAQTNAAGIADGINAIWGTHRHEDNNMARMASYYANDNHTAILNTPQIILPANVAQELTFDYANNMKYTDGSTDVPTSLQLKISIDGGATWTNLASYAQSGVVDYDDPRTFVDIDIDLTAYKGQTIILQFRVDIPYAAGTDGAAFVDNVEIHALTDCKKPRNLHCTDTGVNSATLDWEAGSDETNWVLQYSRDGIIWSEEIAVSSHPYTLTELGPGTFYYARAVAKCSGSETSPYSNIATFTTDCGPLIIDDLPWAYNFDRGTETGSGKIPPCWNTVAYHYTNAYSETTIYPYVHHYDKNHGDTDDYIAHSGTQSLVFYGGDTGHEPMIILPYIEEDMHTLAIDFYHKEGNTNSEYPQFTVGYLRDCEDPSTFVAVQTIDRSLTYTSASVSFAGITDDDVHCIAILWSGGGTYNAWYGWIDDIEVTQDLYIFTNEYGNHRWDQPLNWNKHAVPGIEHSVFIRAAAHVNDGTTGTVRSVVIDRKSGVNSSIEIMPQGRLIIKNTLRQKNDRVRRPVTAENLIINTSAAGNGVLAVGEHDGTNNATVNFYTKACLTGESGWVNQFIGTPFNSNNDVFVDYYGSYIYKFNPVTCDWDNQRRGTPSVPFWGYNILRKDAAPTTLTMQGTLCASTNQELCLTYNGENTQNVFANSWSAPIYIGAMGTGAFTNCEATIYLFNSGTKQQNIGLGGDGSFDSELTAQGYTTPGQFISIPALSSQWTDPAIKVIPSMQAFIVIATGANSTITLDYNDMVYAPALEQSRADITAPTRAPKRQTENKPDIMRIHVASASGYTDKVYLLMREDFSTGFDNGYDGRKMFGVAAAPQLFALSEAGEMSVDCVADAEGTLLGFVPGEDNLYRIFFTYDGQKTLYLNDLQERVSTLIDDDNHYDFTTTEGDEENRFEISEHPLSHITTGVDNTSADNRLSDVKKVLINNQLYIIRGGNIFSATGALVK